MNAKLVFKDCALTPEYLKQVSNDALYQSGIYISLFPESPERAAALEHISAVVNLVKEMR